MLWARIYPQTLVKPNSVARNSQTYQDLHLKLRIATSSNRLVPVY